MNISTILSRTLVFLSLIGMSALANSKTDAITPYQAFRLDDGNHAAINTTQNWQIDFLSSGKTVLRPLLKKDVFHIGIQLQRVNHQPYSSPQRQSLAGNQLTYHWDDNLSEWWVNSESGIEQWFKLKQPSGSGIALQLHISTSLAIRQQENSLLFITPDNKHITYKKLLAWDARGKVLPSKMKLTGHTLELLVDDKDAQYPVTIDPSFAGEAYIEGGTYTVAISGNTLVIGNPFKDNPDYYNLSQDTFTPSQNTGIVHIYTRSGVQPVREWTLQQSFEPVLTDENHNNILFGYRVAIDGDVMAIGNRIYTRTGNLWTERTQLTPIGGTLGLTDSVAISGNTIVIGPGYIFNRVGNSYSWSNQAQLIPSTTGGVAVDGPVAIDGNTVVIGDSTEDGDANSSSASPNTNAPDAGAAYVFVGSGNSWSQQGYLKASNADPGDHFGRSVAISGNAIIVGAPDEKGGNNTNYHAGAAYIFTRNGSTWVQQDYLKANDMSDLQAFEGDEFGGSVAIDGDMAVVGARNEDSGGYQYGETHNQRTDAGAAYAFQRTGSTWSQISYLKEDQVDGLPKADGTEVLKTFPQVYEHFGHAVDLDGEVIAVSTLEALSLDNPIGLTTEAVTVFIKHYKIDVNISGLPVGGSLRVLNSNTGDDVDVTANQTITLPTQLKNGANYNITLADTPTNPNYTCIATDGSSYIQGADILIEVNCSIDMHTVSGNISGLTGTGLVLQNNGAQDINISATQTEFNFPAQEDGSDYLVSVANQPNGQFCTVTQGYGSINGGDINNVQVTCHQNRHSIKGSISGLLTSLVLLNLDTGESLAITGNDSFNFQDQAENSHYNIMVAFPGPQNPSQSCSISNSQGVIQQDVTLEVVCVVDSFRVRVMVYNQSLDSLGNLTPFSGLVLQNNASNDLTINNASVTYSEAYFPFQLDGSPYSITVLTQPAGFNCRVTEEADSSSGNLSGANVTVNVRCFPVFTVTPVVPVNGNISPATPQEVERFTTTDFTLTPHAGHVLQNVSGCDGSLNGNIYTTDPIVQNCTVSATFIPVGAACHTQDVTIGPGVSYANLEVADVKTQGFIATNGSIVLNPGAIVSYTANTHISLDNGFKVIEGSQFTATTRIVDCNLE